MQVATFTGNGNEMTPEEAVAQAMAHARRAERAIWISIGISVGLWLLEYKVVGSWVREMREKHKEMREM